LANASYILNFPAIVDT